MHVCNIIMDSVDIKKKKKKKASDDFEKQFDSDNDDEEKEILVSDDEMSDDEFDYEDDEDTDVESILSDTESCHSRMSENTVYHVSGYTDALEEEDISD